MQRLKWAGDAHAGVSTFHTCSPHATIQAASGETDMAKGEQRGNREAKKPKKEKPKESAAAPSTKRTVASIASSKK